MTYNRKPGLSLLDYLWVNYGDFQVSTPLTDNPENTIATLKFVLDITSKLEEGAILSITISGNNLVIESGGRIETTPLPDSIKDFGRRKVTLSDRNKGCQLPINTPVYYIVLSSGNEYLALIDTYIGEETNSIVVSLLENAIYADLKINNRLSIVPIKSTQYGILADLKISEKLESILLSKQDDGLKADIVLQGSDKFLKFALLTLELYFLLESYDDSTLYFIKGKPFFYFGSTLMMGSSITLDNYYTKDEINEKLSEYATIVYVDDKFKDCGIDWTILN